jgi:hypothetical protein
MGHRRGDQGPFALPAIARARGVTTASSAQYGKYEKRGDKGNNTADDTESVKWHACLPEVIVENF